MLDDTERERSQDAATIAALQGDLARTQRIADLFRQQRDNATRLVHDLQVELAECRFEIEQLRGGSNA